MAVCTNLSVKEIQLALRDCSLLFDIRNDLVCPNVSWGLLPYEADLLGIKKNGIVTEVEIKRSFEDFKKDFEKDHKHDAPIITYFYYCVPECIAEKCMDYMLKHYGVEKSDENYSKSLPAVLTYGENGNIKRAYESNGMFLFGTEKRFGYTKTNVEDYAVVGRLVSLRYWDMMREAFGTGFLGKKDLKIKQLTENCNYQSKVIAELREKATSEWKSMDDPPSSYKTVLVRRCRFKYSIAYYHEGKWYDDDRNEELIDVLDWHELPHYEPSFNKK